MDLPLRTLALAATAGLLLVTGAAAQRPPRADLGRGAKLRILVDKVMQPEAGWHTEEWMVAEAAAAGFNVWSPRQGNDDLAEVARVSQWCARHEIYHMPWMRGSLAAPEGPEADGRRLVWSSGAQQPLWSPNADEFWQWTRDLVLAYARLSAADSTLVGVFLDYENYAPGSGGGNLYELSYDDLILAAFAAARGLDLPALALDQRRPWLEAQQLHGAFAQFQLDHWRQRCRALRQAVDALAPGFQFCIYPAPGTLFMTAAAYPEWATARAPLILADASIYGRPGSWAGHAEGLEANRKLLAERRAWALAQPGGPFMYAGGIDPVVKGADPEFSGRNAAMSAQLGDGYWVFYEGPTYAGTHRDYFHWLTRANRAIESRDWAFWQAPRQTPDVYGLAELAAATDRPQLVLFDSRPHLERTIDAMDLFEVHEMAGNAPGYLAGADVVLLQNFNQEFGPDHPMVKVLRAYVEQGGGLLLGHDTAWFMASPFPEVATRAVPARSAEAGRHVVNTPLVAGGPHPALGRLAPGTEFATEFNDHMIFAPGPRGTVLVRNTLGDPVYVVGQVGQGRVAFSGCYYGYARPLEGPEADLLAGVLRWLAQEDGAWRPDRSRP
ncbi:MAG: hypothetical protein ABIL09_06655 [Gemmatimonadota bacterium]